MLAFTGDQYGAYGARQQQDTQRLERKQVFVLASTDKRLAYFFHIYLPVPHQSGILAIEEMVLHRNPSRDGDTCHSRNYPGHHPAPVVRIRPVSFGTREQYSEYEQNENAAGIYRKLHHRKEMVVEQQVKARRTDQHDQQVGRRPEHPARCDGKDRHANDHRREAIKNYGVS